jgi:enterochelin esterase-like enzyme
LEFVVLVRALVAFVLILSCAFGATAGEILRGTVASPVLGRDFAYAVYLPDAYRESGRNFPVVYLLHGAGGDETAWANHGNIKDNLDKLMASKAIPPAIIVMPGCVGCWWVDGARERAETSFWQDFVPAIEKRYRIAAQRSSRFVAGLSAGGYGAVRFALKYPDWFAGAAAFSPAVYTTDVPAISAARVQPPFLGPDGTFEPARWQALNYPVLLDGYFAQSHRVSFYLVSGDNDRFGIAPETMKLFMALFARQAEQTELRIVDGDHSWSVWSNAIGEALVYLLGRRPAPGEPHTAAVAHLR